MAASYPTAVKSFTTKSAGDTIQPAHINDLQDEITALEGGLLNGTAPLTSSRATVAALTVAGGSTLATLQVAGNSTITGTLTVTTIISTSITAANLTSFVKAYAGDPIQFSTTATQVVGFNVETVDLLSEWDSTQSLFTPQSSGTYQIAARVAIPNHNEATRLQLWINSTLAAECYETLGAGNSRRNLAISGIWPLAAGSSGACEFRIYTDASTSRASSGVAYSAVDILRVF